MKSMLLVAACLLFASTATAVPVNPTSPDGVAAIYADGNTLFALDTNGQSWKLVMANLTGWLPTGSSGLPNGVAIGDVADWNVNFLTLNNGARWQYNLDPDLMRWVPVPPLPSAPVTAHGSSLGGVKVLFR